MDKVQKPINSDRAKYSGLIGLMRSQKLESMEKGLACQQQIFTQKQHENESIVRASFHVAEILAKVGKLFTAGDVVNSCLLKVAKEFCPDKVVQFKAVSLSAHTIACRTEDIGSNLSLQLKDKANG
jgi:hypothetical protein